MSNFSLSKNSNALPTAINFAVSLTFRLDLYGSILLML
jgi:hypothetical protein